MLIHRYIVYTDDGVGWGRGNTATSISLSCGVCIGMVIVIGTTMLTILSAIARIHLLHIMNTALGGHQPLEQAN